VPSLSSRPRPGRWDRRHRYCRSRCPGAVVDQRSAPGRAL
ncbi:MAG: hypothetical protein AVDCRST_MAG75-2108, partial [uncultured Propionibacteriaceae bacterium]